MLEEFLERIAAAGTVTRAQLLPLEAGRPWPKKLLVVFADGGRLSCTVTSIEMWGANDDFCMEPAPARPVT